MIDTHTEQGEDGNVVTHIGKKFSIKQKGNKPPLCQGFLLKYLGDKDSLEHWEATITSQDNRLAEVAIGEDGFWIAVTEGRMTNYFSQLEWL